MGRRPAGARRCPRPRRSPAATPYGAWTSRAGSRIARFLDLLPDLLGAVEDHRRALQPRELGPCHGLPPRRHRSVRAEEARERVEVVAVDAGPLGGQHVGDLGVAVVGDVEQLELAPCATTSCGGVGDEAGHEPVRVPRLLRGQAREAPRRARRTAAGRAIDLVAVRVLCLKMREEHLGHELHARPALFYRVEDDARRGWRLMAVPPRGVLERLASPNSALAPPPELLELPRVADQPGNLRRTEPLRVHADLGARPCERPAARREPPGCSGPRRSRRCRPLPALPARAGAGVRVHDVGTWEKSRTGERSPTSTTGGDRPAATSQQLTRERGHDETAAPARVRDG